MKIKKKTKLKPEDWIKGGFRALSSGGAQAIRIEAIAREMKVSKGSFYWHFKDVAALKRAMLEHWAKLATFDIITDLSGSNITPKEQLETIIKISAGEGAADYGGLKVEGAIRNWAQHDKMAAKVFKKVEKARLQFLEDVFANADKKNSAQNARIFYAGLIGFEHLAVQGLANMEADMNKLLEVLL